MTAPPIPYGPGFLGLPADATEQDILDYAKTYAEEHHDAQAGNLVALLVQRLSQPIADDNHKALVEALGKRAYVASENHLSGGRVTIGFDQLADAADAHDAVARLGR